MTSWLMIHASRSGSRGVRSSGVACRLELPLDEIGERLGGRGQLLGVLLVQPPVLRGHEPGAGRPGVADERRAGSR